MNGSRNRWGLSFLLLLTGGALAACSGDRAESQQPPPKPTIPVAVAPVQQKTVALELQAIGTVEATSVVTIRAQIGGELQRVHVKEGQDVKKGDLLFTIDPRLIETTLAQAQANLAKDLVQVQQARAVEQRDQARVAQTKAALARDMAQLKNAEVQLKRYEGLLKAELIAQEQFDQIKTTAEALTATVRADEADVRSAEETVRADQAAIRSAEQLTRADEAAVANAKVQLGYTKIYAPVSGRAGSVQLTEGNLVRAGGTNDSTLLVINQVRPIYVSFTVPQQQLPQIKKYMAAGELAVTAVPAGDPKPVTGVVTFVDNAVDQATGTIRLKGTFGNEEGRLWPGQFANVTVTLTSEPNSVVVPSPSVQGGQQGPYVYVLKGDSTVDMRRITVARAQGGETVVSKGVEPGEKVVVDGLARLTAGAKVEVREDQRRAGGAEPRGGGGAGPGSEQKGGASGQAKAAGGEGKGPGDGKGERSDAKGGERPEGKGTPRGEGKQTEGKSAERADAKTGEQGAGKAGEHAGGRPAGGGPPGGGGERMTPEAIKERLTASLSLTPEQQKKLDPILREAGEQRRALVDLPEDERRQRGQQLREETRAKIRAILTPEQQAKYAESAGGGQR
jgi:multidrug efflux system membrane fusion protein